MGTIREDPLVSRTCSKIPNSSSSSSSHSNSQATSNNSLNTNHNTSSSLSINSSNPSNNHNITSNRHQDFYLHHTTHPTLSTATLSMGQWLLKLHMDNSSNSNTLTAPHSWVNKDVAQYQ